jgi:translation initiation factor 2 subunit 1
MLYKKQGFPEDDELVLCTITSVQHNSVFAKLDEYGKTGMIHISEISPGRIRNIRDYVVEGKKVVCKVLKTNPEKGYIDLSLRRVNNSQQKKKLNDSKLEQKAEKILEIVADKLKLDLNMLYNEIITKISKQYERLHNLFEDIVINNLNIEKFGIEKKIAKEITELVKQRIKPPEVEIKGIMKLVSYKPDGIETIKTALKKAHDIGKDNLKIIYKGAGNYQFIVKAQDYKTAEKIMGETIKSSSDYIEKAKGIAQFSRIET